MVSSRFKRDSPFHVHASYFARRGEQTFSGSTAEVESNNERGSPKGSIEMAGYWVIYPISDSAWVSLVQVVLKKGGTTVIRTENNILLPSRTVTGWRICIDYRKLNKATRKDHFPLPFLDQMLDQLAGHEHYCFLDGYSGYNQIAIAPED